MKEEVLKSMVIQQITEGFHTAVSFAVATAANKGTTLTVQNDVMLQHPRSKLFADRSLILETYR